MIKMHYTVTLGMLAAICSLSQTPTNEQIHLLSKGVSLNLDLSAKEVKESFLKTAEVIQGGEKGAWSFVYPSNDYLLHLYPESEHGLNSSVAAAFLLYGNLSAAKTLLAKEKRSEATEALRNFIRLVENKKSEVRDWDLFLKTYGTKKDNAAELFFLRALSSLEVEARLPKGLRGALENSKITLDCIGCAKHLSGRDKNFGLLYASVAVGLAVADASDKCWTFTAGLPPLVGDESIKYIVKMRKISLRVGGRRRFRQ